MKKLLFILALVCSTQVNSQTTFQKTYGTAADEQLGSLLKTADGGYIAVGNTNANNNNIFVVKTDSNGVMQWAKNYGTAQKPQYGQHINNTADGGYIITGYVEDTMGHDKALLLKIKANGAIQWTKSYGRSLEFGEHVQQTSDKGYIVIGNTAGGSSNGNIYVFKTDSTGGLEWTKVIAGNGCCGDGDHGSSIMQTADGNYVLAATTYNHYANNSKIYLAKINAGNNSIMWESSFLITLGSNLDVSSFTQTTDKGFIITGAIANKSYLVKTDSVGAHLWGYAYSGCNGATSVIQTTDNGFAFVGYTSPTKNICLYKTSDTGTLKWAIALGDTSNLHGSFPQTIIQNHTNGYTIGGSTNTYGMGLNDFYLLKTDSLGNTLCNGFTLNPTTTTLNMVYDLLANKDTLGAASSITFLADTGCTQNTICYNLGGIKSFNSQADILIYPNPAQNNFTIETSSADKQTLFVYNVNGKQVLTQIINGTTNIDVSNLNAGVYTISIANTQSVINKRLIIVK